MYYVGESFDAKAIFVLAGKTDEHGVQFPVNSCGLLHTDAFRIYQTSMVSPLVLSPVLIRYSAPCSTLMRSC